MINTGNIAFIENREIKYELFRGNEQQWIYVIIYMDYHRIIQKLQKYFFRWNFLFKIK